jgi:hypothetical protein
MNCFFTIPYITFLGLTLLLIIGITILLIRRMNNQNQKFSSIIGVVTTMADELKNIKTFISNGFTSKPKDIREIHLQNTNLIHVSDDDDDEEEEEEEEEEEDDEEDDSDDSDEEGEEDDNEEENKIIEVSGNSDDIKYIQIDEIKQSEEDIISDIIQGAFENIEMEDKSTVEDIVIVDQSTEENPIKEEVDYKKLPLQKLRSIVLKKKLVEDSSKMKKNELLLLLEKE